jgi:hypothetical protein
MPKIKKQMLKYVLKELTVKSVWPTEKKLSFVDVPGDGWCSYSSIGLQTNLISVDLIGNLAIFVK